MVTFVACTINAVDGQFIIRRGPNLPPRVVQRQFPTLTALGIAVVQWNGVAGEIEFLDRSKPNQVFLNFAARFGAQLTAVNLRTAGIPSKITPPPKPPPPTKRPRLKGVIARINAIKRA